MVKPPEPIQFSPLAVAELEALAEQYGIKDSALFDVVAGDAHREISSAANAHVPWFRKQPLHNFHAARIRGAGLPVLELYMVVSPNERTVYSSVEAPLPDEYFAQRVIEEMLLEVKLGHLKV